MRLSTKSQRSRSCRNAARWLPLWDLRQVNWLPADLLVIDAIEKTFVLQH